MIDLARSLMVVSSPLWLLATSEPILEARYPSLSQPAGPRLPRFLRHHPHVDQVPLSGGLENGGDAPGLLPDPPGLLEVRRVPDHGRIRSPLRPRWGDGP